MYCYHKTINITELVKTANLSSEENSSISGWLRCYLCTLKEEKYQCLPATASSKTWNTTILGTCTVLAAKFVKTSSQKRAASKFLPTFIA